MFHNNSARTGQSAYSTAGNTGAIRWTAILAGGADQFKGMVVDGGNNVYVTTNGSAVYAFNASGAPLWASGSSSNLAPAPGPSDSFNAPALSNDGGTLYFTDYFNNVLYAVNTSTGMQKWSFDLTTVGTFSGTSLGSPAIGINGTIYLGDYGCDLLALTDNGSSASLKWAAAPTVGGVDVCAVAGLAMDASPTIDSNGTIYVGDDDGNLYSFTDNGPGAAENWGVQVSSTNAEIYTAALNSSVLYVGSDDNNVYAIKTQNGKTNWTFSTGGNVESAPAIGPNGRIYVSSGDGYVYSLTDNGRLVSANWRFTGDSGNPSSVPMTSSPAIGSDGRIYVGVNGVGAGTAFLVYALVDNGSSPSTSWTFSGNGAWEPSPAIGNDETILIFDDVGEFFALNGTVETPTPTATTTFTPTPTGPTPTPCAGCGIISPTPTSTVTPTPASCSTSIVTLVGTPTSGDNSAPTTNPKRPKFKGQIYPQIPANIPDGACLILAINRASSFGGNTSVKCEIQTGTKDWGSNLTEQHYGPTPSSTPSDYYRPSLLKVFTHSYVSGELGPHCWLFSPDGPQPNSKNPISLSGWSMVAYTGTNACFSSATPEPTATARANPQGTPVATSPNIVQVNPTDYNGDMLLMIYGEESNSFFAPASEGTIEVPTPGNLPVPVAIVDYFESAAGDTGQQTVNNLGKDWSAGIQVLLPGIQNPGCYQSPTMTPTATTTPTLMPTAAPTMSPTPLFTGPPTPTATAIVAVPGSVQYAYDAAGRLIAVYDQAGNAGFYNYDAVGNLLGIQSYFSNQVAVAGLSSNNGVGGQSILTIYGTDFTSCINLTVTFNGTPPVTVTPSPTSVTSNQIIVKVPSTTTGTGEVQVNCNGTPLNAGIFTIGSGGPNAPSISGFSPAIGPVTQTDGKPTAVTINGTNFAINPTLDAVAFNGQGAPITSVIPCPTPSSTTACSIVVSVPAMATSGNISVTTPYGTAVSSSEFIVEPQPSSGATPVPLAVATSVAVGSASAVPTPTTIQLLNGYDSLVTFNNTIAGQTINVLFSQYNLTSGATNVAVIDPMGTLLTPIGSFVPQPSISPCAGPGQCYSLNSLPLPLAGTYTLLLGPAPQNGSVNVQIIGNGANSAATIAIGGAFVTPTVASAGQFYYQVAGAIGQQMSLGVTSLSPFLTSCPASVYLFAPQTLDYDFEGNALDQANLLDQVDLKNNPVTGSPWASGTATLKKGSETLPVGGLYTLLLDVTGCSGGSSGPTLQLYDATPPTPIPTISISTGKKVSAVVVSSSRPGQPELLTYTTPAKGGVLYLYTNQPSYLDCVGISALNPFSGNVPMIYPAPTNICPQTPAPLFIEVGEIIPSPSTTYTIVVQPYGAVGSVGLCLSTQPPKKFKSCQ